MILLSPYQAAPKRAPRGILAGLCRRTAEKSAELYVYEYFWAYGDRQDSRHTRAESLFDDWVKCVLGQVRRERRRMNRWRWVSCFGRVAGYVHRGYAATKAVPTDMRRLWAEQNARWAGDKEYAQMLRDFNDRS